MLFLEKNLNIKRIIIVELLYILVCIILFLMQLNEIESYFLIIFTLCMLAFSFICYEFLNFNERKFLKGYIFKKFEITYVI